MLARHLVGGACMGWTVAVRSAAARIALVVAALRAA